MRFVASCVVALLCLAVLVDGRCRAQSAPELSWRELPALPEPLGVAGPFVGVHGDRLVVAGGANFPQPVWENEKSWRDRIYILSGETGRYTWTQSDTRLPRSIGYGANVSTPDGIVCVGGNDATNFFKECFRLAIDDEGQLSINSLPPLPTPLAYSQACLIGGTIYVAGGQTDANLASAVQSFWSLDLNDLDLGWQVGQPWPGPPRAFNLTVAQNNGFEDCLYVMGGRCEIDGQVEFLADCWEYSPKRQVWRERASLPFPLSAGTAVAYGKRDIFVLSGDDGELFGKADRLRDEHPGFLKRTLGFNTITNTWRETGESPANQVTTTAVLWEDSIVVPTGEVRPRVRSPRVWQITVASSEGHFTWLDYVILILYLSALVWIGVYFSRKTKNTDDYFRASGNIPWWAAGCSIFATMLSSLTFTGIPSKAFAQDWVYAVGNMMIPVVAFFAVAVALPFYRKLDVTSAYEYLEHRFHWSLRAFGSAAFSLFHLFRMAIVMSLTGLALAVATPLTPAQSVILMGVLSIVYCTLGGVSAVIWTDTLQTFVLLGGALLAIGWMLSSLSLPFNAAFESAWAAEKLRIANIHASPFDPRIALWVILLGGIGQNISSYTADQAVVQRYMTTPNQALAARAIWTNALLTIPATVIFFSIGTCLFLYYKQFPARLDPTITTDQVFPLFISRELPMGLSGLIVAAVFAAAQSTVSTSMNSVATTLVTDCVRPLQMDVSDKGMLRLAQFLTVMLGLAGTAIALVFIDENILSLFDQFLKVIGIFMGVLGGLFVLGALFKKLQRPGSLDGSDRRFDHNGLRLEILQHPRLSISGDRNWARVF